MNLPALVEEYRRIRAALLAERVRELLHYDPDTGVFTWRVHRGGLAKAGTVAGTPNGDGYRRLSIDGRPFRVHQVAWLYMFGELPALIDHIDGDPGNNSIANLRLATMSDNIANSKRRANNQSGYKGVTRHSSGRWRASITKDGKRHYLGLHSSAEAAHTAYVAAARAMFGDFARGE
jgi:hypothetical protein